DSAGSRDSDRGGAGPAPRARGRLRSDRATDQGPRARRGAGAGHRAEAELRWLRYGWVRQGELPVHPGRVLESEEPVHPPTAIRLPEQQGDVSTVLGHADAARVAPGLFEGAELRRLTRRDASRRDGETEIHVLE